MLHLVRRHSIEIAGDVLPFLRGLLSGQFRDAAVSGVDLPGVVYQRRRAVMADRRQILVVRSLEHVQVRFADRLRYLVELLFRDSLCGSGYATPTGARVLHP